MMLWDQTISQLLHRGGLLMWPLVACSVIAVALIIDRAWAHVRVRLAYPAFVNEVHRLIAAGRLVDAVQHCARRRSPIARTAEAYLRHVELDDATRTAVVQREGAQALEQVEMRQRGLSAVAHIATLTGLLGTVVGLVAAFHQIELAGGQVQPSDLAAGIWQALLTTVFGLTIAIPSYAAYHVFESGADRIARRMGFMVSYLDQWSGKHTGAAGETTGEPAPHRHEAAAPAQQSPDGIRQE